MTKKTTTVEQIYKNSTFRKYLKLSYECANVKNDIIVITKHH